MAGPSLQKIFGFATLSKAIYLTTQGIPNVLPESFSRSKTKCVGDKVRWRQFTGERRVAKKVRYGAKSVKAELRDVGERAAKAIHFNEEIELDPLVFKQIQSPNSYEHDTGMFEVERQVESFGVKFGNTRFASTTLVFRNGVLNFDRDGNLLNTAQTVKGGSVAEVINFGMNPLNQNQLDGIISSPWSLPTTDIVLQLRRLKKRARRLTGLPLKIALYGENVPSYFFNNASVQQYLARHPQIRDKYVEGLTAGEIPDGLFNFIWIPAYEAFFEDANQTNLDIWDPDAVTFCPEVNENWYDVIEGSMEVPTTINIQSDAVSAMRSSKTVHGMGGYGLVIHNPVTVESHYFDTFLPTLKNPDAVFQADVAW